MELWAGPSDQEEPRRFPNLCREENVEEEIFVRRIDLKALSSAKLTPEQPSVSFRATALPENAMAQELSFRVTNAQGVDMPCAKLQREGNTVTVTALGDGSMYLRASANHLRPGKLQRGGLQRSGFWPRGVR